jgi:hypothetical protein
MEEKEIKTNDDDKAQAATPAKTLPSPIRKQIEFSENVKTIRRACGYITIISTAIFAFIALLSIWIEIGDDVVWKSLSSLAVVGFSSLIASAVAPLVDKH